MAFFTFRLSSGIVFFVSVFLFALVLLTPCLRLHAQTSTQNSTLAPASAPATANPIKPKPKQSPPAQSSPQTAPSAPTIEAPYEGQLLRLAEILGTLSYLRDLCGARDGKDFRAQMNALIGAEAANEARRDRLAGAFNKGFQSFETVYRSCTANAESLMNAYIEEGGTLSRDIASRFGG
jgi:uncharacterized protein (TIGR02301 family)